MKKSNSGKSSRRNENNTVDNPNEFGFTDAKPLNYIQGQYIDSIKSNSIIFGVGSAGTGKTFLASNFAASELFHRRIKKIIITRPNIEVGRGLGFLPGELEDKFAPFLEPFDDCFNKFLGKGFYEYCLKSKAIEPKPLGYLRGKSFEDAIVLADEMQNASIGDMKMLLSRIGKNCKMIISGDPDQCDIPNSGLIDAVNRLNSIPGIDIITFLDSDIVRSKLCKQIIIAYKK